jgi:hypothetical protein
MEPPRLEKETERGALCEGPGEILGDAPGLEDDRRSASRQACVPLGQDTAESEEEYGPERDVLLERDEDLRRGRSGLRREALEEEKAEARGSGRPPAGFLEHAMRRFQDLARLPRRETHAAHVRLVEEAGRDDLENKLVSRCRREKGPDLAGQALPRRPRPEHVPRYVEPRGGEQRVDLVLEEVRAAAGARREEDLSRPGGSRHAGSAHPGKPRTCSSMASRPSSMRVTSTHWSQFAWTLAQGTPSDCCSGQRGSLAIERRASMRAFTRFFSDDSGTSRRPMSRRYSAGVSETGIRS